MIDLNDVLLAMSNIPVDDPTAEIWGRGLQGGYKIIEYTGSLPITITADGNALLDYRIYGADSGVGEPTENLFDESTVESGGYIDPDSGNFVSHASWSLSDYIKVTGDYINLSGKILYNFIGWAIINNFYDSNKSWLGGAYAMQGGGTIGARKSMSVSISGVSYVRVSYRPAVFDDIMLVEGSTVPTNYIPYGYKLPMVISNGNTAQTVPVYIGDTPLEEDEYVSYGEQKIYKRTENLFPSAVAQTQVVNGVTATCDGNGRYSFSGTATETASIFFIIPKFTYPDVSITDFIVSFFNSPGANATCDIGSSTVAGLEPANRVFRNSISFSGRETSRVKVNLNAGETYNFTMSPMVVLGTVAPSQFVPHIAPTDPPVSFPDIPTIKGETVIDYDGTPKPSQMYIKYKGKG